jgi:acetylornithine deacetylase/succinyl-diaminopimelate desuccinylase-like protein
MSVAARGAGVNRLVEDLVELAQIPAPTFAEEPRMRWLAGRLDGRPGRLDRDEVGNTIWSWGTARPRVLFAAHVDTVFPADTDLAVRRDGDDLVGPGIGDNAAAVAVAVNVVEGILADAPLEPGAVVFTVGEEGLGNLRGATHACQALDPEAFIALEGHGLDEVVVDAVGSSRARIQVTGPGGHSWRNRGAPSAIDGLIAVAAELRELARPEAPINIGTVDGGRSINTIADEARMLVERRALDQDPLDEFERVVAGLELPAPLTVESEIVGRRPAGRLERDAPVLRAVLTARQRLGLPTALTEGSTDANAALAAGIDALCIGVGRGSGMHSLQERIDARSLEKGAAQLEAVLRGLLGPASNGER